MTLHDDEPDDDEPESACGKPCDPDRPCDECDAYWQRMVSDGFWDRSQHRWTDKGWREITK